MALESHTTRRSPHVKTLANPARELNELAGAQGPGRGSNIRSNKAHIFPEAPIPLLISLPAKDLFIKFLKIFIETTQAWDQEQLEPQERPLKAKTPETYSRKSYIDCYHFCQQCEDYFETSSATGMNYISFAATFLCSTVSLR